MPSASRTWIQVLALEALSQTVCGAPRATTAREVYHRLSPSQSPTQPIAIPGIGSGRDAQPSRGSLQAGTAGILGEPANTGVFIGGVLKGRGAKAFISPMTFASIFVARWANTGRPGHTWG